jgi:hypothetical protein
MKKVGYKTSETKYPPPRNLFYRNRGLCGFCLALAICAGCGPMYTKPLEREPATRAERNFRDLWDAACTMLKEYGFTLDRQDRRDGVMTTYAVSGGHGLEALWRKDASNMFQFRENTTQNILRAARVTVFRLPDRPDEFDFRVEVRMARSNRPQPQMTDTVEINRMPVRQLPELRFSDLETRNRRRGEKLRGVRAFIVPLGEDEDLAARIDQAIRNRTGLPYSEESQSPAPPLPSVTSGKGRRTMLLEGTMDEPKPSAPASQSTTAPSDEFPSALEKMGEKNAE